MTCTNNKWHSLCISDEKYEETLSYDSDYLYNIAINVMDEMFDYGCNIDCIVDRACEDAREELAGLNLTDAEIETIIDTYSALVKKECEDNIAEWSEALLGDGYPYPDGCELAHAFIEDKMCND